MRHQYLPGSHHWLSWGSNGKNGCESPSYLSSPVWHKLLPLSDKWFSPFIPSPKNRELIETLFPNQLVSRGPQRQHNTKSLISIYQANEIYPNASREHIPPPFLQSITIAPSPAKLYLPQGAQRCCYWHPVMGGRRGQFRGLKEAEWLEGKGGTWCIALSLSIIHTCSHYTQGSLSPLFYKGNLRVFKY